MYGLLEKLRANREARKQHTAEQRANEIYQVTERNGVLWITFNNFPVIPEDMLKEDIRNVVTELRGKYIERNKTENEF